MVGSNWKITLGPASVTPAPLVVLAFGQAIEGEFKFPWSQQSQKSAPWGFNHGVNFARGASVNGLSLTTINDHANDAAARLWCLRMQIAADAWTGITTTLKLEIRNFSGHFIMDQVSLDDCLPMMRIASVARTQTEWHFGGAGWTEVP